ncbi:MAG: hypothetical protein ABIX28_17740 [Vicinamibacterales bacterium]
MKASPGRLALAAVLLVASGSTFAAALVPASPPDLRVLMAHVGERVAGYYDRAHSVMFVERSIVQPIASNWSSEGLARTVESELRVEYRGDDGERLAEPRVTRRIRQINGREPRERDRRDRSGCTDPSPVSPEPLAFVLPAQRDAYQFLSVRDVVERGRPALVVEFASVDRTSDPELIEDARGHDDCFDWRGRVATRGRMWIDSATHDVLRVDRRIPGPVSVRVPLMLQRRHQLEPWMTLDRDDVTMRYRLVTFTDPDEVALMPEAIESLTVFRGGLQSARRVETYSEYRRFVTGTRIIRE